MIAYRCDLCNEIRDCTPRQIEHTEYDICNQCWEALTAKLEGKGRPRSAYETVTLPVTSAPEPPEKPNHDRFPGAPPTIYGSANQSN